MEGLSMSEKTPLINPSSRSNTSSFPATPIQLSGFFNGDTVQVEGDTGDLQFSVQFNVHKRKHVVSDHVDFDRLQDVRQKSLEKHYPSEKTSSSSYVTPNNNPDAEHYENANSEQLIFESNAENAVCSEEGDTAQKRDGVVTRLRSGSLSATKYSEVNMRKRSEKGLLERVLRKHSLPVRPCNSYAFFVMATWDSVKSSSFGETTKSLAKMWSKLPHEEKKAFEAMASKDSARYKRQCMLLSVEE